MCCVSPRVASACFDAPVLALESSPRPHAAGTTISALAFNKDGAQLAVAASYTHDQGPGRPHPADTIFIRSVADSDVRPKAATAAAGK